MFSMDYMTGEYICVNPVPWTVSSISTTDTSGLTIRYTPNTPIQAYFTPFFDTSSEDSGIEIADEENEVLDNYLREFKR